jgi:Protein N-terminal asparagine amidohydrolase
MVILQSSDSTGTLVSLNDGKLRKPVDYYPSPLSVSTSGSSASSSDHHATEVDEQASCYSQSEEQQDEEIQLHRSALFLPEIDDCSDKDDENRWYSSDDEDDDDDCDSDHCNNDARSDDSSSCYFSCSSEPRHLYLPLLCGSHEKKDSSPISGGTNPVSVDVDEYLPMDVIESAEDLLAQPVQHFSSASRERVLYVAQGEVAHAVPLQCDVLMSDRATTCHILALRSYSDYGIPLTSVAHVDDTCYEECLRDIVERHHQHHLSKCRSQGEARTTRFGLLGSPKSRASSASSTSDAPFIRMEVHMVGGFADPTSRNISNFLMYGLATIAAENYGDIKFTLQTCAISSVNGNLDPIGRGLAIDMRTGRPFLARADPSLIPAFALRSARLFQRGSSSKRQQQPRRRLACIHDQTSNDLVVEAFPYEPCRNSDALLSLDDALLLRCTSTSPHCEEDDFCASLRATLQFLSAVPPAAVFGRSLSEPVVFKRAGRTNAWRCLQPGRQAASRLW